MTKTWWWALDEDAEVWQPAGSSRTMAIETARENADGGPFTICTAEKQPYPFPVAATVLDFMVEAACDNDEAWGDEGPTDIDELSPAYTAAVEDFKAVYEAWCARHIAAFPAAWLLTNFSDTETFEGVDGN